MLSQEDYEYICKKLYVPAYLDEDEQLMDNRLYTVGDLLMIMAKEIEELKL